MSEQKKTPVVKRPYVSPVIQVYGNIRAITQSLTGKGKADGGKGTANKTGA